MFSTKPKPPTFEQKWKSDIVFEELKSKYQVLFDQMGNIPDEADTTELNSAKVRKALLDQREAYYNIKTILTIIKAYIRDAIGYWPEGKNALSLLMDSATLTIQLMDNMLEENHLWDRSDPLDNYSQNRRAKIYSENKTISYEGDKKLLEGNDFIFQLTGWKLVEFEQD